MSKVLAIAAREIRERSFVFLAAAALAAAPFLALLMPSGRFADRLSATTILGVTLATAFVIGLGILLGVSLIGRETREKRLSFYFARPVSASAIWFGKLVAALALLAGSAVIVFTPPAFLLPSGWRPTSFGYPLREWYLSLWSQIAAAIILGAALVLIVHAVATMLRAPSLLLVVDFIAATVFLAALWSALLPIFFHSPGFETTTAIVGMIGGAICAALVFGGAWQLARARIDPKRSHRELSIALWCALAVVAAGTAAGARWLTSATPGDLTTVYYSEARDGSVVVQGRARHRFDLAWSFLFNTATGAWTPAPQGWLNSTGTVAIWLKPLQPIESLLVLFGRRDSGDIDLQVARLQGDQWEVRDSGITMQIHRGEPWAIKLSPSGDRVAILSDETVTVFSLGSGRSIGSAHIPVKGWIRMKFIGADSLIVTAVPFGRSLLATRTPPEAGHLVAYRFDPGQRTVRQLLDVPVAADVSGRMSVSNDGRTVAFRQFASSPLATPKLRLFDVATGTEKASIAPLGNKAFATSMLSDGTIATTQLRQGQGIAAFYSPDGALLRAVELGRTASLRQEGELPDGRLLLSVAPVAFTSDRKTRSWSAIAVDPKSGAVTRLGDSLRLVARDDWYGDTQPHAIYVAYDSSGLVAWNALTGQRRLLVAKR